jgi:hypothetical protein
MPNAKLTGVERQRLAMIVSKNFLSNPQLYLFGHGKLKTTLLG